MKFFTEAWHRGDVEDDEAALVVGRYNAHLDALEASLPGDALRLARTVSLHDGLIRRVAMEGRSLEVLLRAGDQQVGYFDACLRYGGAEVSESDLEFLQGAVGQRRPELLYDELDVEQTGCIHRILFWPYREVRVIFQTFGFTITPVAGRWVDP